jgi:hypothetical protein
MRSRCPVAEPAFTWDRQSARYRDEQGRFVARAEVQRQAERVIDASDRSMRSLTDEMRVGRITIGEWQDGMADRIGALHAALDATGRGGLGRLEGDAARKAEARIVEQLGWLDRYARDVEAGYADGSLAGRSGMYAQAGRGTYSEATRDVAIEAGYTWEVNLTHAGESCIGCLASEALGKVPIGTLPPVGTRNCLSHCRCEIAFGR